MTHPGTALDRVVDALEQHGHHPRRSGAGYSAQCPAHEDHNPSLSITPKNGKVLLCCQVGCSNQDILTALNLDWKDLWDPQDQPEPKTRWTTQYEYTDEHGDVQFVKERGEPKTFRIYRPLPGGQRQYKDVFGGPTPPRRVLYRLPAITEAIRTGTTIYITEGEKDAHAAEQAGAVATCNYEGAAKAGQRPKWRREYGDQLHGAHVVIVADNDEAGYAHAAAIRADLTGKAASVRVVRGLVATEKADLSDHLAAGHTLADLVDADVADATTHTTRHLSVVPTQTTPAAETDGANALDNQSPQESAQAPAVGFDYTMFGLPAGITTPTNYRVTNSGIALKRVAGKDETWARFTFAPLVVTATFEDPDGEQRVELSWVDSNRGQRRIVSRIVSREIAKRGKELIKHLGGAGLPAVEGDARLLERWLAEFEAANHGKVPSEQLARWLGWQPDGTFVASQEEGVKVDVVYDEMRAPASAHGCHGTFDDWKATVKGLEKFPVVRAVIAASLAAPLLRLLRINSFTVDISSRSTGGKTTSLLCALSVWANPGEDSEAMSNWNTTEYAIEKRLNLVRGIVTVFDETQAVRDDTLINEVLYQVPLNHGKGRGGGHGSSLPWETILLSSGERPALSFTTGQGATARVLCATVPPFGPNGGEAADRAKEGVLANFGHAGPAFVAYLREGLAKPSGIEKLRDRHRELTGRFRGDNDMTRRRAPMVAMLALAEILACRAGLLPYEPLPEEQWRQLFAAYSAADNRPEMAMDVVREHIAGHSFELYDKLRADIRQPVRGWLGAITQTKDGTRVAILPEKLRDILSDAGYVLDAVVDSWIDAGYLELRETQRPPHKVKVSFDGRQAKCFVFTPKALELDDVPQEMAS